MINILKMCLLGSYTTENTESESYWKILVKTTENKTETNWEKKEFLINPFLWHKSSVHSTICSPTLKLKILSNYYLNNRLRYLQNTFYKITTF